MYEELLSMRALLGWGGLVWGQVALIVSLFGVVLFRSDRIQSLGLFRAACWLLALSFVAPPLAGLGFQLLLGGFGGPMRAGGGSSLLLGLLNSVGPLLVGASLLCGLFAVLPRRGSPPPAGPARHPLD